MSTSPPPPAPLLHRFLPAMRLDPDLFAEVAANPSTRGQALLVVLAGGVLNGLALRTYIGGMAIWAGVIAALLSWLMSTLLITLLARLLRQERGSRSLARPLGFAHMPTFLLGLGVFAELYGVVRVLVPLYLIATSMAAIQAAYQTTRLRAGVISAVAAMIYLVMGIALDLALG